MKAKRIMKAILVLMLMAPFTSEAQNGKFSGYMFGDYYWFAANHNSDVEGNNGVWFRRVYFTYDKKLGEAFSTRLRLEMANPDGISKDAGKAVPFIKDAYLKWKKGHTQVIMGISPTPTWGVIEKIWGYRSVEKTPLDLQKFGSSRDFGIAVKGNLDPEGKVKYHLMLANGNSNKSENNKGKKAMLALAFYPSKHLVLEGYVDWNDNPGATDWLTLQGFAGYKSDKTRFGLHFTRQVRKVAAGEDLNLNLGSVFLVTRVSPKTSLFARVDRMFDANPKGNKISYIPFAATAKSTFFVGGLDVSPVKNVHLMPNVELVIYDGADGGDNPKTDILPRFTFYYKF